MSLPRPFNWFSPRSKVIRGSHRFTEQLLEVKCAQNTHLTIRLERQQQKHVQMSCHSNLTPNKEMSVKQHERGRTGWQWCGPITRFLFVGNPNPAPQKNVCHGCTLFRSPLELHLVQTQTRCMINLVRFLRTNTLTHTHAPNQDTWILNFYLCGSAARVHSSPENPFTFCFSSGGCFAWYTNE